MLKSTPWMTDDSKCLLEARQRLFHLEWILGQPTGFVESAMSYRSFVSSYQLFALTLLHEAVGQAPRKTRLPLPDLLIAYRFRRCFPPMKSSDDPLDYLGSYNEKVVGDTYSEAEMISLLEEGIRGRGAIPKRIQFRAIFSNKATMEYTGKDGGFNRSVKTISSGSSFKIPCLELPVRNVSANLYAGSPMGEALAKNSARDRQTFRRAFESSVKLMRSVDRPPLAFVSILDERSLKKRIPAVAEGFCQILSQSVSDIGKTIQTRLFPLTKGGRIKMPHEEDSIYLSGDYKDSTNYIIWEAITAGYYMLFKQAGLSQDEFDMYMEIVRFLVSSHVFYSDNNTRSAYRSIFAPRAKVIKPKLGFDTYAYMAKNGHVVPIVCKPVARGSAHGTLLPLKEEFPHFDEICSKLKGFVPYGRILKSLRGVLMCYSMAAPALHLVGALPHWKFRGLLYVITGDDNASRHKSIESIIDLETEKLKTGMVPHDSQKSARGKRGLLIAERLLVVQPGKDHLVEVENFPIRILFPERETEWHAVTMPEAVFRNIKDIHSAKSLRIISYVYWKFEPLYQWMESVGITIGGANGLFPVFPATKGAINAPGGLPYSTVFRRPGTPDFQFSSEAAFAILCPPITIPMEDDLDDGYKITTDSFPDLDSLLNAMRPFGPLSNYDVDLPSIDPFAPTIKNVLLANIDTYKFEPSGYFTEFGDLVAYYYGNIPRDEEGNFSPSRTSYDDLEDVRVRNAVINYAKFISDGSRFSIPSRSISRYLGSVDEYCCSERGYRAPLGHFTSAFTPYFPDGSNLREISIRANHWFIDVANTYPGLYREQDGIFPIESYLKTMGFPKVPQSISIYLILECPGITCMSAYEEEWKESYCEPNHIILSPTTVIKCFPRVTGHAGADNEFRMLSQIIYKFNPRANLFYTSLDKHWIRQGRKLGMAHIVKPFVFPS
jgi:hypothetical protein